MKKFNYVLILLGSIPVSAFACPDLTGAYECVIHNSVSHIQISATVDRDTTTYRWETRGEEPYFFITDGEWRPLPAIVSQTMKDGQVRAFCDSDSLKSEIKGRQAISNAPISVVQTLKMTENRDLANSESTTVGTILLPAVEVICKRE